MFYYAQDIGLASRLWTDILGFRPRAGGANTADWIELDGAPIIFLGRTDALESGESSITVRVDSIQAVIEASRDIEGITFGERFEVEPGHVATTVTPAGCQSLLIHE